MDELDRLLIGRELEGGWAVREPRLIERER